MYVYLDPKDLTKLREFQSMEIVATHLLQAVGLSEIMDIPNRYNLRVFKVQSMPDDVPTMGIHWLVYKSFVEIPEYKQEEAR